MSTIKQNLQVVPQDVFATSTTQGTDLGAYATTGDGRVFRYGRAAATALTAGLLVQGPAEDTSNLENLIPTASAIGVKTVTLSTTPTIGANQLSGGYLAVTTGAGYGYMYKIAGNTVSTGITTATSPVITLEDPLQAALVLATSKVDLYPNPYGAIVVNPTTATSDPLGAVVTAIAGSAYGWIQTHGPVTLTVGAGGLTVGGPVVPSATTAGQVIAMATTAQIQIGTAVTGVAANESGMVSLSLD